MSGVSGLLDMLAAIPTAVALPEADTHPEAVDDPPAADAADAAAVVPLTFIEVCAGAGGLSTGLVRAGLHPLFLNEIDATCCTTLRTNHPGVPVVERSMLALDLRPFAGSVGLLTGGVPCQSFSQAGLRQGLADPRGGLAVDFARLVRECRPQMFLVENVRGLVSHAGGETLRALLELYTLEGAYTVVHRVLNANDYGVAQKRQRLFIVGIQRELAPEAYEFPAPDAVRRVLRDVLEGVPPSPGARYPEHKRRVMELVPPGGCWVDLPPDVQLAYMGARMLASGGGKRGVARRLSYDAPSLTLTTSPSQKQTERCHPEVTRPLAVREYARIQSFSDEYVFCGSVSKQYAQIGNAVPVLLAERLGHSIAAHLRRVV